MPHIGYKLQLPHNYPLHNLITTYYHHPHTTEIHANIKENTSKYFKKYTEIQIKVELRCPHYLIFYRPISQETFHHKQRGTKIK